MNWRVVRLCVLVVVLMAAAAVLAGSHRWRLPPAYNPWAPLDVAHAPNLLTRFKLARLSGDEQQCRAVLASTGMAYQHIDDEQTGPDCGFSNAVRVERTASDVAPAFALSCRTAVSLALWERHGLQPAALRHFGQPVARIQHFGSYACRNVYGRPAATRSRHATAEAWDVAGFTLGDGQRIRIARDWDGDPATAAFLREARDAACRYFDAVLSPDYNAAHHDHLHLDRGPYRLCR